MSSPTMKRILGLLLSAEEAVNALAARVQKQRLKKRKRCMRSKLEKTEWEAQLFWKGGRGKTKGMETIRLRERGRKIPAAFRFRGISLHCSSCTAAFRVNLCSVSS